MTGTSNIQHVNVKIFAEQPATVDLAGAIPVFHRWIQDSVCEELLVDVADYRHVPAGPGVMLIGHEASYSLDLAANRLGLLYNRKAALEGSVQDKLLQAYWSALGACRRLEEEPAFQGKLKFDAGRFEVLLNDRLLAPNTDETWRLLKPDFTKVFDGLFGAGAYTLERLGEPRERFRTGVKTHKRIAVRVLLESVQPA